MRMAERIDLTSPCHSLRGPVLYHCPSQAMLAIQFVGAWGQLKVTAMTQSAAGEERRDEMDPSYPLKSATVHGESENKAMKH